MQTHTASKRWFRLGLLAAAVSAPAGLLFFNESVPGPSATYAQQTEESNRVKSANSDAAVANAESLSVAFRNVAKVAKPSVVSITSMGEVQRRTRYGGGRGGMNLPPGFPEEFRRFFEGNLPEQFGDRRQQQDEDDQSEDQAPELQARGVGSGVIVSADGYIVTNSHVVADSAKVMVQLSDDREIEAKVVGVDTKSDLAVIKIEATGLVPAALGESNNMEVGDWVVAIGSPFGLAQTVTSGIVSAKNRSDFGITDYDDFIQTDAAINPGNSGGPLLNLRGEVIGINTAIASRSGGFNGIGFAIPSSIVKRVMDDILKEGHVIRGFMGAGISDNAQVFEKFKLDKETKGVVITATAPEAPAAKAGIQAGDVVTAIDGTEMRSADKLRRYVANLRPGTTSRFTILRDGKSMEVNVTVEEQNDERLRSITAAARGNEVLGLKLAPVGEELAQELQLQPGAGLLVEEVAADSPFAKIIRPGEVILEVNGVEVQNLDELNQAYESSPKRVRILTATRNGLQLKQLQQ
jgi:serine protease Do